MHAQLVTFFLLILEAIFEEALQERHSFFTFFGFVECLESEAFFVLFILLFVEFLLKTRPGPHRTFISLW